MDTNYFVCTLGQAARLGAGRPFQDVNHLIDELASTSPKHPAVGFYTPSQDSSTPWQYQVFDFATIQRTTELVAELIREKSNISQDQTVGLLSASSPEFLFVWLSLIRLGHPVLLIAPQCSPSAIAHLSKTCDAPVLFHDGAHEELAEKAIKASKELDFAAMTTKRLPFDNVSDLTTQQPKGILSPQKIAETDVAYLHHTSGTSSGVPKPIPQSHRAAVGVLPALQGSEHATFTTTPLYHGGVADLFRAWASSALIWLFPGQHLPITASNVMKCLSTSELASKQEQICSVKYFSSVPYVLQLMAQESQGLKQLQAMNIVGVGGAALPAEVGDKLVQDGVNLVSRFGSAECGFAMSSHRDYETDKEWQYLRRSAEVKELSFEAQEGGLSELVILDGWPHMAKRNREDRSFATADLFAPHTTIADAWKYHSRSDSQLTLITGKKFDPAPLEGSIAAASAMLVDVLVFGNGKPYPGALLFRSEQAKDQNDDDLKRNILPIIEKINADSQSHARIPRNMLILMPYSKTPLDKSSKGTILRASAEEKYKEQIESAYNKVTINGKGPVPDDQIKDTVLDIIQDIVGSSHNDQDQLTYDTELFAYGVDSVASIQIRHLLVQLLPEGSAPLPLSIVEDCGTISRIGDLVLARRHGKQSNGKEDSQMLLKQLVEQYSTFDDTVSSAIDKSVTSSTKADELKVLLTGPTGSLGSHILSQLLSEPRVKTIYLLVRGATQHAAKERVVKALAQKDLTLPPDFDSKVIILPCKLSEPRLGLSDHDYNTLTSEISMIFHLAWSVNFLLSLRSIASTHLAGLKNLLDLALSSKHSIPPKFLFCSSVASVSNLLSGASKIPESITTNALAAGSTGYAQSKLAAELICSNYARGTRLAKRITVLRVGQLSGATTTGVWSKTEAYPLIFSSSKTTNVLPNLGHQEKLNWLPVDIAAQGFIQAAFHHSQPSSQEPSSQQTANHPTVLHLLNPSVKSTFPDLLQHIKSTPEGKSITIVSPDEWLDRLSSLENDEKTKSNPALRLLSFWREVYGSRVPEGDDKGDGTVDEGDQEGKGEEYAYEMTRSLEAMPCVKPYIGALDREYMLKLWRWVRENIE